jgi:tRNA C32,U32 (ribose-2'-O)-methylase TrmJ
MTHARFNTDRRTDTSAKDLELIVRVLEEALTVIDDYDPDRNPARCMRQLRRLLDNAGLRAAIMRLATEIPLAPESRSDG